MFDRFKFRVYDDIQREMYNLEEQDVNPYNLIILPQNNIMQCTGLKDKAGKLIYEGDIVHKKGSKNWKKEKLLSKVVWSKESAAFMISDENGLHQMPLNSNNIEVLGNIFENPQLLKGA